MLLRQIHSLGLEVFPESASQWNIVTTGNHSLDQERLEPGILFAFLGLDKNT
jgi:hypothetical protein